VCRTPVWKRRHLRRALRQFEIFCIRHRERPTTRTLPEPITKPERLAHLTINRRDRLGGVLNEDEHAA